MYRDIVSETTIVQEVTCQKAWLALIAGRITVDFQQGMCSNKRYNLKQNSVTAQAERDG